VALALAMLNVIINEKLYDAAFVAQWRLTASTSWLRTCSSTLRNGPSRLARLPGTAQPQMA